MSILITLEKPTKPMREEAADAGRCTSKLWHKKDYPKIQESLKANFGGAPIRKHNLCEWRTSVHLGPG